MSHGQTWTHKTHHSSDLGETTTFPLIIYYVPLHEATSKWHFVPGLQSGSPKIAKVGTPATLGAYNFTCRPWIEMRSQKKI